MLRGDRRGCQHTVPIMLPFSREACLKSVNPEYNTLKLIGNVQRLQSSWPTLLVKSPSLLSNALSTILPTFPHAIILSQPLTPLWNKASLLSSL